MQRIQKVGCTKNKPAPGEKRAYRLLVKSVISEQPLWW